IFNRGGAWTLQPGAPCWSPTRRDMTTAVAFTREPGIRKPVAAPVTVIVPAYNEAASIADTICSLRAQTVAPADIIVVDDCSTDGTGDIARAHGVTVLRPPVNTGSKAGAQTFALDQVRTELTIALAADTT